MARHGVDAALLGAADPGQDGIGGQRTVIDDPYSAAAHALRCRAVLHSAVGGKVAAVTVFGFASDRQRVELLFTSLLLQATSQLVRLRPPWPGESVAAYRRSWLYGFTATVHRRLTEAEARAADEYPPSSSVGPGLALVPANRSDQVERAYAEEFGHLRAAPRASLSGSGFSHGAEAGRRADLGRGAVARSRVSGHWAHERALGS